MYKDKSIGKLTVHEKARDLTVYTIQITSNEKVFLPKYKVVSDNIIECVLNIQKWLWTANDIRVVGDITYNHRRNLQTKSIAECNNLLSLIYVGKKLYHLSAKRCRYWTGIILELRNLIRKWSDSDKKRYKP